MIGREGNYLECMLEHLLDVLFQVCQKFFNLCSLSKKNSRNLVNEAINNIYMAFDDDISLFSVTSIVFV